MFMQLKTSRREMGEGKERRKECVRMTENRRHADFCSMYANKFWVNIN